MAERTRNESSSFDASKREIQEIQEILLQKSISLLDRLGFSYSLSEREFRIDYGMPTLALEMPLMISAAFGPEISTVETSLEFPSELKSGSPKEKETDAWPAALDHPAAAKIRRPELEICQRERQLELCRFLMEVSSHSFPGFFRADFENQRLICQFSWMSRATDTDLKSLLTILFPACARLKPYGRPVGEFWKEKAAGMKHSACIRSGMPVCCWINATCWPVRGMKPGRNPLKTNWKA